MLLCLHRRSTRLHMLTLLFCAMEQRSTPIRYLLRSFSLPLFLTFYLSPLPAAPTCFVSQQALLSLVCDVFRAMFDPSIGLIESRQAEVSLPEVPADAFLNVLRYIYIGMFSPLHLNVQPLLADLFLAFILPLLAFYLLIDLNSGLGNRLAGDSGGPNARGPVLSAQPQVRSTGGDAQCALHRERV